MFKEKTAQEEAKDLKDLISGVAEKTPIPSRFNVSPLEDKPSMQIKDNMTGKSTIVPLFAYGDVRKVLSELFG